jgi:hypothetical protein
MLGLGLMAKVPGFAEARSRSGRPKNIRAWGGHNRLLTPDRQAQARPASEIGNGGRNSALIPAALPDGVLPAFHAIGANHEQ